MKHDILRRTSDLATYKIPSLLTELDRKHILLLLNSNCNCQLSAWTHAFLLRALLHEAGELGRNVSFACYLVKINLKAWCFLRISEENLGELSHELWVGKNFPSLSLKPEIRKADGYYYFRKKALKNTDNLQTWKWYKCDKLWWIKSKLFQIRLKKKSKIKKKRNGLVMIIYIGEHIENHWIVDLK